MDLFETQYRRRWNVFINRSGAKAYRLQHDGRFRVAILSRY
jgi:hypothetical protein